MKARGYKKMTAGEMFRLIPETEFTGVTGKRGMIISEDLPENYFEREIAAGHFQCTRVESRGVALYRIIWQLACGGTDLLVLGVQTISGGGHIDMVFRAGEKIARNNNCRRISFCTNRRALAAQAMAWGAEINSVWMKKLLPT